MRGIPQLALADGILHDCEEGYGVTWIFGYVCMLATHLGEMRNIPHLAIVEGILHDCIYPEATWVGSKTFGSSTLYNVIEDAGAKDGVKFTVTR